MRYYVEGSPTGPESFADKAKAIAWAVEACERFGVGIYVYDSTTHGPLPAGESTAAPFATFRPKRAKTPAAKARPVIPGSTPTGPVIGYDTRSDGIDYRVCPECADDRMFAGSVNDPTFSIQRGDLSICELCGAFLG